MKRKRIIQIIICFVLIILIISLLLLKNNKVSTITLDINPSIEISLDKNELMIGNTYKVIIEGYSSDDDVYVGRTYKDAPGVDGLVFVNCDYELMSGDIVDVIITEAGPYDLIGEVKEN